MTIISILNVVVLSLVVVRGDAASLPAAGDNAPPASPEASARIEETEQWSLGHGYLRRGDQIFFKGERIDEAGRETLTRFERALGRRLALAHDVDAASFAALSEEYSKDRNAVYYKWISPGRFWVVVIPDADPATFEVMDFNLAKDANRVWRTDVSIEGADAATARVVNPGWVWRDSRSVYYQFTRLADADPETFRHLNQAFYRDAKHVYADAATFRKVAELRSAECVLFQDAGRRYLFDPSYIEVYTLTRTPDSVVISKPAWLAEVDGSIRHAATVSATWKDGVLSEPQVEMQPGFNRSREPAWEVDKLKRLTDAIREAMAIPRKDSVAATDEREERRPQVALRGDDR